MATRQRWIGSFAVFATLASSSPALASSLADAVKAGDRAAVKSLLQRSKAEVNAVESDGTTALHWAVEANDLELMHLLIKAGAVASTANRYGVTPLQLAAVNGEPKAIELLLEAGADPNAVLPEGETVLMTAARTGRVEAMRLLLDRGAKVDARENWYGETPLIWAAGENHPEAVKLLLARGADVNARSGAMKYQRRRSGQSIMPLGEWTPLMYAARQNAIAAGRVLIAGGADLNLVDPDGATALVVAIINGNYDFAAELVRAGADPNIADKDAGMAALYATIDMHRLAIGHGRPNPRTDTDLSAVDLVKLLLEKGADPNAKLKAPTMQRQHTAGDGSLGAGATPLLRASKSGDIEVIKLLLAAGADLHGTLPNKSNAIMFAAGLGWRDGSPAAPSFDQGTPEEAVEAIRLLKSAGLDINSTNDAGDTPLHAAVSGRASVVIVRALLAEGANLTAQNKKGLTPLAAAMASRKDLSAVVAVLREAEAAAKAPVSP
jgi:ankyrin repeat protein